MTKLFREYMEALAMVGRKLQSSDFSTSNLVSNEY